MKIKNPKKPKHKPSTDFCRDFFRSEEMSFVQFLISKDAGFPCISKLGIAEVIQLEDLNAKYVITKRLYVHHVQRCYILENRIHSLKKQMKERGIYIPRVIIPPDAEVQENLLRELEYKLNIIYMKCYSIEKNISKIRDKYIEIMKQLLVLQEYEHHLMETMKVPYLLFQKSATMILAATKEDVEARSNLYTVVGSIPLRRLRAFQTMLWRVSHGNMVIVIKNVEFPPDQRLKDKVEEMACVILIFYGDMFRDKIDTICKGNGFEKYDFPDDIQDINAVKFSLLQELHDIRAILDQIESELALELNAVSYNIDEWKKLTLKLKAIYTHLDYLNWRVSPSFYLGRGWIPKCKIRDLQKALIEGSKNITGNLIPVIEVVPTNRIPPTFFKVNKFTRPFQVMVDSYGVPSYGEINPGFFSIITFPFLFGIMFGDVGHSIIYIVFSSVLIVKEKELANSWSKSEITNIIFTARYLLLLLGMFSFYTGFLYCDVFSKPFNIIGSSWSINFKNATRIFNDEDKIIQLDPHDIDYTGTPCYIGMDPVWKLSSANIPFENSFKMKTSIIVGILHMLLGLLVSFCNFLRDRKVGKIFLDFLPQVTFLICIFCYLIFLMIFKWNFYGGKNDPPWSSGCAPLILVQFVNMILFKSPQKPLSGCMTFMYPGQPTVEIILMALSMLSIPILMLGVPIHEMIKRKKRSSSIFSQDKTKRFLSFIENSTAFTEERKTSLNVILTNLALNQDISEHEVEDDDESGNISELFLHQMIRAIESILGCVSHTASYLRLWAISLAHSQLSDVCWNLVLRKGFILENFGGSIVLCLVFIFWAMLTLMILVAMEGLAAFLHTLRLHWVEFQSKFYEGRGHGFNPFSFRSLYPT